MNRRTAARTQLRHALDIFERPGAAPWAEREHAELRATGETARRRNPSTLQQLTPQEMRIVLRVAEVATNKAVAAQLFISPPHSRVSPAKRVCKTRDFLAPN
jgi:FixJ family two-component response regulator